MNLRWDIRTRVLVVAMVPTLALGILLTLLLTFSRLSDLEDALVQRGTALARQLASASEYGLFAGNREVLDRLAASTMANNDLQGVAIFDSARTLMAVSGLQAHASDRSFGTARVEQVGSDMLRIVEPVVRTPAVEDDPYILTSERPAGNATLGEVVVLVSLEQLQSRKRSQMLAALGTLAIVLVASVLLAALMSQSVSGPIRSIAQAVTDIGRGLLATRVPVRGGGSLRRLAEGVNDMAASLTVARDELEQRVSEATDQLRQRTDEAERANLAKSRFLAAASHDLRQPMHALGLFIADLARKEHNDQTRALIERIAASAEAMENLLNGLLDISKLDAGVVSANPQPTSLTPLFQRINTDYQQTAGEKGLRLRVRPTELWVHSDPLLLERIILNLVGNALRYTARGSVLLAARKRGDTVRLEVRDSGIGIPPEAQESIFQEFVQLDNPARDRSKGLGLGLAIVRRLALLMGHDIGLHSLPGRGSTFWVDIPVASPVATREHSLQPDHELLGCVVGVVDDDALAQQSLAGLLRAWGCYVVAADGLDALLEAFAEAEVEPQILVSDFRLPGEYDGLTLINAVRARYRRTVPALLLSGDTGPETLRRAIDYGIPLLHKPVRPAKLRAMIIHLLAWRDDTRGV
ncbi:MAG: ATP-binding protein [Moraxellaceae bacterium]|nr:ATP-binding protein [Moraxellaceae bacterium]